MATNAYLLTITSKNQNKQTSRTETELKMQKTFWWLPDGKEVGGMSKKVKGRSTNRQLQNSMGM